MKNGFLNKIETLFETELIQENFPFLSEKNKPNFEFESNHLLLENLGYFGNEKADWNIYFSRLTPFFEFGILFHKNILKTSFYYGELHDCPSNEIHIKMPSSKPFNVLTTDSKQFLKKMKLDHFFDTSKFSCYFIRINEDTCYMLFSKRAEPWNKLLIESLQKSMINYSL